MGEHVPIALAVVPGPAVAELADRLSGEPQVTVMQHGWQHANHARHGKKSEAECLDFFLALFLQNDVPRESRERFFIRRTKEEMETFEGKITFPLPLI